MQSSDNTRQAAWVAIGQFCSFAIGVVSPMILSRYFTKGDYGTYKQVMYVYSSLIAVFTFGIPRAYSYFIPRVSLAESKDIIRKISCIFFIIGLFLASLFFWGSPVIAEILKNPELILAFKYFAPTPLFLLPVFGFDCIMASYHKTQIIALYSVLTKLFSLLCIVLPVILFDGTYIHAIIGFDISSFISYLLAVYLRRRPTKGIQMKKTSITIRQIIDFSVPLMIASVWIMIFQSVNQFFVSRYYGTEVFADFSNGFMDFPFIPMIVSSVATVLMPLFSKMVAEHDEGIKTVWMSALSKSVKITYPIAVYSIVFSTLIMLCLYGDMYENSGLYFRIKNLESFFTIVPFYPLLLALGKTRQYSNIHMVMALIIIPLEYLVVLMKLPAIAIGCVFVMCSCLKVILQFLVVQRTLKLSFLELVPLKNMGKALIVSLSAAVVPFALSVLFCSINRFLLLAVTGFVYVVSLLIMSRAFHVSYKDVVYGYLPENKLTWIKRLIP